MQGQVEMQRKPVETFSMLPIGTFHPPNPESHGKKILMYFNPHPTPCQYPLFPKQKNFHTLCLSLTSRKRMQFIFFFSFQIMKKQAVVLQMGPCYYMHLFCLLTQIPRDACFHKTCLSSLMGPSHISDTDYLASQPISWLISRRM